MMAREIYRSSNHIPMSKPRYLDSDPPPRSQKTEAARNRELAIAFIQVIIACIILMLLSYLMIPLMKTPPVDLKPAGITSFIFSTPTQNR